MIWWERNVVEENNKQMSKWEGGKSANSQKSSELLVFWIWFCSFKQYLFILYFGSIGVLVAAHRIYPLQHA